MRLLVAEDERDMCRVICKRLKNAGYAVDFCYNGIDALHYIEMGEFDGIILDIMMPGKSGLEVIEIIRSQNNLTPVLLLTAKDSVEDRVRGLDAGATDYLIKPFAFEELLARIRAMTRNASGNPSNVYELADLTIDTKCRRVFRCGEEIVLSSKEYDILVYLMMNKGVVLSREKIENHVWNFDYSGGTNVVDVYIRYLRKKIDDPYEKKLIRTVRGFGYVLKED